MQENTIFVKRYQTEEVLPINEREVMRYAGYLGKAETMEEQLKQEFDTVIEELKGAFNFKVCYRRMSIEWKDGVPVLPFASESKDLAKALRGSAEVIMFAATIGLDIDRYIARWQRISPLKALVAQAYGAERIESLCDTFCNEMKAELAKEGLGISPRFSPGYGDLVLNTQVDFFKLLDCSRQVGISLNDSLLMTPSKSVTAIMGVGCGLSGNNDHDCSSCSKTDCEYRRLDV